MKKILLVSMIVASTFAGISAASAVNFASSYPAWAVEALDTNEINN